MEIHLVGRDFLRDTDAFITCEIPYYFYGGEREEWRNDFVADFPAKLWFF